MAGRATSVDGIRAAIFAANPHLDKGRDDRAVRRLAWCYKLTDALHADMVKNPPTYSKVKGTTRLDEYHKLYADALRLEQELGITPAARRRHGIEGGDKPPAGYGLEGAKA